jgi:hypothetical protein
VQESPNKSSEFKFEEIKEEEGINDSLHLRYSEEDNDSILKRSEHAMAPQTAKKEHNLFSEFDMIITEHTPQKIMTTGKKGVKL